jgi:hypothetical protein
MRRLSIALVLVAVFAGGAVRSADRARAEDPAPPQGPPAQKEVKHAFLDAIVGTWAVETTGGIVGKGKTTFAKGVGGTAVLETYENRTDHGTFHGHGILKVSDDGKTVTVWWLDNFLSEPLKLTGPLKETGYEISGDFPGMGSGRITLEKKGDGLVMKMFMDGQEAMVGTYTRER